MIPPAPSAGHAQSILIVDDEDGIRTVLRRLLVFGGMPGLHIREAASAEQAFDVLSRERFDVVVTDFRMRAKTGLDLLAWLQEHHPTTRRVLMTGYNDESVVVDPAPSGRVEVCVRKPWDNRELLGTIRGLLGERGNGAA